MTTIVQIVSLALKGNAEAQNIMGQECFGNGDYDKAIMWWNKSAAQGNADALYNLGMCYYDGFCVNRNLDLARHFLVKASKQNHIPSIDALSRLFKFNVNDAFFLDDIDDDDIY